MSRVGGFIFTFEEMRAWGARLVNEPIEEISESQAMIIVLRRLHQAGINMTSVTYPTDVSKLMVVTKKAAHSGWREGNDPTKLKQFKAGRTEAIVKKALEKEGIQGLEFVTSYGPF